MKKNFQNEKGFTLVELLAVIVILGIIVAIAVPAIGNVIDRAEDGASEAESELIEDAAKLALINAQADQEGTNEAAWVFDGASGQAEITPQELVDNGYLDVDTVPSGTLTANGDSNFTYTE